MMDVRRADSYFNLDYSHHPHFVTAERALSGINFGFRPFTGDEPEPVAPSWDPWPALGTPEREAQMTQQAEFDCARDLWLMARYRRALRPLFEKAAPAWRTYAQATTALDTAWEALHSAPVWQVAVLRLLEAQDAALAAARTWEDHDLPIAELASRQETRIREHRPSLSTLATEAGFAEATDWRFGCIYDPASQDYEDGLVQHLTKQITRQRERLREIAKLSNDPPPT
jgi:hypothetical protein